MINRRRPLHAFLMLCVVGLGASAAAADIFCLFLDECIGFSMLNEVVDVVDAVDVDAWVDGGSRSSLVDGVVGVILMWISLFSVVVGGGAVV